MLAVDIGEKKLKKILIALCVLWLLAFAAAQWVLPARIESSMNVTRAHEPYNISNEARQLHESLFVADLHADSLLWKRDLTKRSNVGHVDLPRMNEGNVALQVFGSVTKTPANQNYSRNEADSDNITKLAVASLWPVRTWRSIFERAVYQGEKLQALAEDSELELITSKEQMRDFVARRAAGEDLVAGIYLIEGAHPLEGDIAKLDALFEQGLRVSGLTHFFDNELGGSLHGISGQGLTQFGEQVVRRADELEMTIDVAHASPQMVKDVLDITSRPVILSHGGVKGACDSPRNLDDDLMKRIAANGGIVGIGFWKAAVCDASPKGIVKSIRYAINLLGAEHVALGSDYDGAVTTNFDSSELAVLTHEMLTAEFTEQEIRLVMGENVKRFFLENLPD